MVGVEAVGGWLVDKLIPAIGGLFGGLAFSMFWTPEVLREKGRIAAVFIAGGVSTMSAVVFAGVVAFYLGVDPDDANKLVAIGAVLGGVSVAVMNWLGKFMAAREHLDIVQVGLELKDLTAGVRPKRTQAQKKGRARRARK